MRRMKIETFENTSCFRIQSHKKSYFHGKHWQEGFNRKHFQKTEKEIIQLSLLFLQLLQVVLGQMWSNWAIPLLSCPFVSHSLLFCPNVSRSLLSCPIALHSAPVLSTPAKDCIQHQAGVYWRQMEFGQLRSSSVIPFLSWPASSVLQVSSGVYRRQVQFAQLWSN